jgi:hypothetical protein
MINNPNEHPHLAAVEILEECMAKGDRFAFEMEAVVMADLRPSKLEEQNNAKNN